ncbi:MAG: thioredoxin domain-containing protein [Candidatus Saccharimonadales bacterium]
MKIKIALGLLLIGGIIFWISSGNQDETSQQGSGSSAMEMPQSQQEFDQIVADRTPLIIGDEDAPFTMIEYADFKCSACAAFHNQAGKDIREQYVDSGEINIEIRGLTFIGPDSERALRGGYCSNEQGIFTEYHDAVFDYTWDNYYSLNNYAYSQDFLTTDLLSTIASDHGADESVFRECIESSDMDQNLVADMGLAEQDRVRGTPTFMIGDQSVSGPQPFSVFQQLIELQI